MNTFTNKPGLEANELYNPAYFNRHGTKLEEYTSSCSGKKELKVVV